MNAPPSDHPLVTDSLRKVWPGGRGADLVAVEGATFSVAPGEVFGLLGPNGAGKTTLMRMIVGMLPPTSGRAWLCGVDVGRHPFEARRRLGYLSASSGLPSRLTAREVLALFAGLQGVTDPRAAADRAIQRFSLGAFADRMVDTYSTGMRQRARLATALVHDPAVVILDEPTLGLDVVAAQELIEIVRQARGRGAAVVYSTHILDEAERLCDRIGVIHEGRLRAVDTPAGLLARTGASDLHGAFLALVREGR